LSSAKDKHSDTWLRYRGQRFSEDEWKRIASGEMVDAKRTNPGPGQVAQVSEKIGVQVNKTNYSVDNRNQLHKDANKFLDQNLLDNEKVQVVILGLWDSAIIGTDRRAFVYKRGLMGGVIFGSKLASWDYLNLSGVQIETGPATGFVSLQGPGIIAKDMSYWNTGSDGPAQSPFAISIYGNLFEQARKGVALLRELISQAQQAKGGHSDLSVPDQIAKLAQLRDQGILTSEEFELKKKELLSRM